MGGFSSVNENRIASVRTASGYSSLDIVAKFLKEKKGFSKVYMSNTSLQKHKEIMR